jgi:hypothetical protein
MGLSNTSPPSAKIVWPVTHLAHGGVETVRDLQPSLRTGGEG